MTVNKMHVETCVCFQDFCPIGIFFLFPSIFQLEQNFFMDRVCIIWGSYSALESTQLHLGMNLNFYRVRIQSLWRMMPRNPKRLAEQRAPHFDRTLGSIKSFWHALATRVYLRINHFCVFGTSTVCSMKHVK